MEFEFKLPDLGEGITEGEVVKWRVNVGDRVEEHQVVVEVETDKAIVEVPSPRGGKVSLINRKEGETVSVGAVLMKIETGEAAAAPPEKKAEEEKKARPPSVSVVGALPEKEEVMAAPKARALAKKLGVELAGVTGTGPGGIVTESDVKGASEGRKPAPPQPKEEKRPEAEKPEARAAGQDKYGQVERIPIRGVRKAIAKNLLASQRTAAFVTGMDDADVTELWTLRKREGKVAKEKGAHLTFLPFFMKAAQHALQAYPMVNASVDEKTEEIVVKKYYNIGVAVDTPEGLMVSVVKNVEKKTILELATELQELSIKARDRKITLEELKGSTFTISNFGTFGGTYATPIINFPDVAILGTGKISERPWVVDGSIAVRKVLPISFTFDHRIIDGADAARFVNKVKALLEDPGRIFIESA
ncbi:MAG TPA: 2-oxo acid dehydrogenase subunit E2 [Deltaproteobacteria bacterium]|nr:MAG: branched-chain alpha-keto acid dehydrogenase subunit E2 [Deltaproteobacteria bacterium GWA2_55_82]OGQ64773.1 MAG: branched-chain alpha-keto acid dehydrogenase subunit E2 [Deltaproteobacteria bacterium RIFCSPLOWO2_02_FULL_55_12]OIJ72621.1 MAG: branched-chain alpha-keto acid dehydrogenase subunit E2 [Deltaproteobacteria bacterium GWC2_55_46]HBG47223.1 2-oxo acid dehydrogenase subunit E2 [Deltaproteobacteria bacterium]HCY11967.1 2-oxo acid dehydrogenase subunit E2 [Deltaproteobacteria bact